ncbi:hypothetical protein [Mesobacillus stamsii]|uniref:Uncharacterized membrane protein YhaH (DUF805 family) n=1 Tax=Mesobacillus stamsii TaxID=225347 RepID=A0ABU0FZ61_9BACI|nr:hypothetical protein [Mesobacillus stamsii]MDQ0414851.1 uncharacterized membrane protein YhaH (DUF805 family) [Mesobacillus stamsii]
MDIFMVIIFILIGILVQYAIIELAVKRGIDASETKEILEKILKNQEKNNK